MKRRTTRRNSGKTVSLRNFTGKVRRNPDGTVTISGLGKKKKRRNVAAGFYDEDGYFQGGARTAKRRKKR